MEKIKAGAVFRYKATNSEYRIICVASMYKTLKKYVVCYPLINAEIEPITIPLEDFDQDFAENTQKGD